MIDNEEDVFHQISDTLMSFFDSINVTNQKLRFYHSSYPVVSVVSTNNFIFEESLSLFETSCLSIEEFEFEIQYRHSRAQRKKEKHFEKLSRDNVAAVPRGAGKPEPRVCMLAVATARPEATEPAEGVRYRYAYGYKRKRVGKPRVHFSVQPFDFGARTDNVHIKVPNADKAYNSAD